MGWTIYIGDRHSGKTSAIQELAEKRGLEQLLLQCLTLPDNGNVTTNIISDIERKEDKSKLLLVLDNIDVLAYKPTLRKSVLELLDKCLDLYSLEAVATCRQETLVAREFISSPFFTEKVTKNFSLKVKATLGGDLMQLDKFKHVELSSQRGTSNSLTQPIFLKTPPFPFIGNPLKDKLVRIAEGWKTKSIQKLGLEPPSGLILYGKSGTGKTLLARTIIYHLQLPVFSVTAQKLFSKYLGETEERIRQLFDAARKHQPCVILLDGIHALAPKRSAENQDGSNVGARALSQLLNEMDGISASSGVWYIACTHQPLEEIDPAILRPGRLEIHEELTLPDDIQRRALYNFFAKKYTLHVDEDEWSTLTKGMNCGEMKQLVHRILVENFKISSAKSNTSG